MGSSRLFAYNNSGNISGASQSGSLAISNTSVGGGSVKWWNGPNEDLGFVVSYVDTSGTRKSNGSPVSGTAVGFRRSASRTSVDFLSLANSLSGQNFLTASVASDWLNNNGFYSTYVKPVIEIPSYPLITTNGLVTLLDAGSTFSYPIGGGTIYDAVGSNNGTLTNGVTYSANTGLGGSLSFDGVDDYVSIGPVQTLTSFSVDVWFYVSNATPPVGQQYYGLMGSFANALFAYTGGTFFLASFGLSIYQYSTGGYNLGAWNNVVFTYDLTSQNAIFYINGVYDSTTPSVTGINYSGDKFLGLDYPGASQIMKGNIGVVKVYSRAINSAEVTQNYNAMKSRYI